MKAKTDENSILKNGIIVEGDEPSDEILNLDVDEMHKVKNEISSKLM